MQKYLLYLQVNGDVVSYEVEVEELHPKITGKHSPFR